MFFESPHQFKAYLDEKYKKYPLLAFDVGERKIGVAKCDSELKIPVPLQIIIRKNKKYDMQLIQDLLAETNAKGMIIGLPIQMDGQEGKQAAIIRSFIEWLDKSIDVAITIVDERLTTFMANDILKSSGVKRKRRNEIDDMVSANIILEQYLNTTN
jgi:putative Holliday junction resolvase